MFSILEKVVVSGSIDNGCNEYETRYQLLDDGVKVFTSYESLDNLVSYLNNRDEVSNYETETKESCN